MTKTRFFPGLIGITVFLAACAPGTTPLPSVEPAPLVSPTVPPASPALTNTAEAVADPTETLPPSPLPLATSRGPDLHATDPATVSLASGDLQLVEFFRFT